MATLSVRLTDTLGLLVLFLFLLDYLRPSLLLLPTIPAGGDTPCHYPTLVYLYEHLLPQGRLHGWYQGAYLGHPLLLYYFPLPFLVMAAMTPALGMPVAFKIGTVLGAFLLPFLAYASMRLMGFRFPGPLLSAAAAVVFLFVEDNPIWGGTLASTLVGEFAYAYGVAFGLLFLGCVYRAYTRGARPWLPAAVLALTALSHGYAVLWAGLSATYFLYAARRPARTLIWLLSVGGLAFALAGVVLVPLLSDWGWTTSYDDPWITVALNNLVPPLLWPLLAVAVCGVAHTFLMSRRTGGPDHRILFLAHAAVVAAALAAASPALGVIDVRFVPFAHLTLAVTGGAVIGVLIERAPAARVIVAGLLLLALVHADGRSQVLRPWIEWDHSGLEAKEHWPAFQEVAKRLAGTVRDPRVAVEYDREHEKAGSIRVYETLPLFSGRSTLEGLYNQASLQTHAVYYVASELGVASPNPFRRRAYSRFDPDNALRHLRLFNVSEIVAVSPVLTSVLRSREDVEEVARIPPYVIFRLRDAGAGYVEPLAFTPVRSSPSGWRDKAYHWFTRKPLSQAPLVFTEDAVFPIVEPEEWLAPPTVPLPSGVQVQSEVDLESVTITTNRVGHPLLVKISYHPRWKAEGADGPYLVSPAMMLVIPRQNRVRLSYALAGVDHLGWLLTLGAVGFGVWGRFKQRPARSVAAAVAIPNACDAPAAPRRWGALIPGTMLLVLTAARFVDAIAPASPLASELYTRATRAHASGAFTAAAEYLRHAVTLATTFENRERILRLRGECLLRAGQYAEAKEAFQALIAESPKGPGTPEALYGLAEASMRMGESGAAAEARERLLREFPDAPEAFKVREATSPSSSPSTSPP